MIYYYICKINYDTKKLFGNAVQTVFLKNSIFFCFAKI